tara:strand:- start:19 stop:291 length:273 start_codon:yes stop_codon:yes gene_type:complete
MTRKKLNSRFIQSILLIFIGFFSGVGVIWPGIIKETGRKCFLKIVKDGSDGSVSLSTIFEISPNYLMKIKNSKNKYSKILLVGDFCFRKF